MRPADRGRITELPPDSPTLDRVSIWASEGPSWRVRVPRGPLTIVAWPGADAEVGARVRRSPCSVLLIAPSEPLLVFQVFLPFRHVQFADRAGQRGQEVFGRCRTVPPRPGCGRRGRCTASHSPAGRPPRRRRSRAPAGFRRPSSGAAAASRRRAGRSRSTRAGIVLRKSSRQLEHCRSVKTWIETGASEEPRRSPSWGTPPKISWASAMPATWTTRAAGFLGGDVDDRVAERRTARAPARGSPRSGPAAGSAVGSAGFAWHRRIIPTRARGFATAAGG